MWRAFPTSRNGAAPGAPYHEVAGEFLTLEVNAAVHGLFEGGAVDAMVVDVHGPGAINIRLLNLTVQLTRGKSDPVWPLHLDTSYDLMICGSQHAKAGTRFAHIRHTCSWGYTHESVNGISIGESGELPRCAGELGVRTISGSADYAFTQEAQALVPGLETFALNWGLDTNAGDDVPEQQYMRLTRAAHHLHPEASPRLIRQGVL